MIRKLKGQGGMSLVEATIILMTLSLLTAVLAPSIGDYVNDAKHTKGQEDVTVAGTAIIRVVRDSGFPCLKLAAATACTKANRVDILRSSGADVALGDVAGVDFASADLASTLTYNWDEDGGANGDTMESQFVLNTPNYDTPNETTPTGYTKSGPQTGLGWRGAYMSSPIGADPWGKVYLANTAFLSVASDATAGTAEGNKAGGWSHDVLVISAGPNGVFDTAIAVAGATPRGTTRAGDDLIYIVSGDTR